MRATLAVLVVAVVGCGPSSGGRGGAAPASTIRWANASGLDAAARARAESAWRAAVAAEASNRGAGPLVVDVTLHGWDVGTLPAHPGHEGFSDWSGRRPTVELLVGGDLTVPWAYHELCHVRSRLSEHTDPRWATWEAERLELLARF